MKKLLIAFAIFCSLISCSEGPKTNDAIDPKLRQTIAEKNNILAGMLRRNRDAGYRQVATDRFIKKDLNNAVDMVRHIYFQNGLDVGPEIMDEFYSADGQGDVTVTSEKHGYTYTFFSNEPEYYLSVFKIHPNEQQHHLVFAVYHNSNGDWLLDKLFTARYEMFGNNGADMLAMAKKWEERGYMIDAYIHAHGANLIVYHAGEKLVYNNTEEIVAYEKEMTKKIEEKYGSFPIPAEGITTRPQIIGFDMAYYENALYPAVHFATQQRDDELKKEYEALKIYVRRKFPDLASNQKYVFYRALDEDGTLIQEFKDEN